MLPSVRFDSPSFLSIRTLLLLFYFSYLLLYYLLYLTFTNVQCLEQTSLFPQAPMECSKMNLIINYLPDDMTDVKMKSIFPQFSKIENCNIVKAAQYNGGSRNFRKGFQFIKKYLLFSILRPKKKGLSNLEVTFVAFLSLNIGLSVLSNLLNPFTCNEPLQ